MRYNNITTDQAIEILANDGVIYFTGEAWADGIETVDWLMVSIFFNTQEIHGFTNGYKVRIDL